MSLLEGDLDPENGGERHRRLVAEVERLRAEIASRQRQLREWYGKLETADEELAASRRLADEQAHMLKIARAMLRDAGKGDLFELQCAASIKGG